MIPRVIAALTKFLSPIASSLDREIGYERWDNRASQRFKKKKQNQENSADKPEAKEAHPKTQAHLKLVSSKPESPPQENAQSTLGTPFTHLFSLLNQLKGSSVTKAGSKAYQNAQQVQKKSGKFRKGSILDEKIG